jgi:hypothetical protein
MSAWWWVPVGLLALGGTAQVILMLNRGSKQLREILRRK